MNGPALSDEKLRQINAWDWQTGRIRGWAYAQADLAAEAVPTLLAALAAARGEVESLTRERDALQEDFESANRLYAEYVALYESARLQVKVLTQRLADVVESFDRLEDDAPELPELTPRELFESAVGRARHVGRARLPEPSEGECEHAWKFNGGNPMCRKCGTPKSPEPSEGRRSNDE